MFLRWTISTLLLLIASAIIKRELSLTALFEKRNLCLFHLDLDLRVDSKIEEKLQPVCKNMFVYFSTIMNHTKM